MKNLIKIIVIWKLIAVVLIAQNSKGVNEFFRANNIEVKPLSDTSYIDPYSFFPSEVGDFWQYAGNYLREYKIAKDSLLSDGSRYVYEEYWERPTYQIDTNYNVVFDPIIEVDEILYVLDKQIGESWWVYFDTVDSLSFSQGELAIVDTIYQGNYLNRDEIFKVIKYFIVTIENGNTRKSWDHDVVLASGMGLVYKDIEAERPMVLISAILDGDTLGTLVSVKDEPKIISPNVFTLSQNYPNPFNPTTTIAYQIPKDGFVNLVVYNSLGQIVATLVNEHQTSGKYSVQFSANNLPSGVFFYKIESGSFSKVNGSVKSFV